MTTSTAAKLPKVKFQSLAAVAQSVVPVTFGQVFLPGALPAGSGISAGSVAIQVDVKTAHPDGSARHAILSGLLPALAANETQSLQLALGDTQPVVAEAWPAAFSAQVKITLEGVVYTASAAQNDQRKWLDGAVVTETHSVMILQAEDGTKHPHLTARFAIRDYHGTGKLRADVILESCWAYAPAPQNFTYGVEVLIAGVSVYSATITHLTQARWRKVFWYDGVPAVNVQHDLAYLVSTGVAPNYDTNFPPYEADLAKMAIEVEPMGIGFTSPYMPMTGGRDDLGLLPAWAVRWLMTGDSRARAGTLATADGAGSFGMHYRDQKTDLPLSVIDYPYATIEGHASDTSNPLTGQLEAFPAPGGDVTTAYIPDTSHQPSLAYLPYLLTGDYFYLEELQFWAMYNVIRPNPSYRQGATGLVKNGELRAQAWNLRTLAEAAAFTPDNHPLKSHFTTFLSNNLDWYNDNYTYNSGVQNALPVMTHDSSPHDEDGIKVAPWMDDFFVSAVGHAADLGFTKAIPLLHWKAQFTIGRMIAPGVCFINGAPYDMTFRDSRDSPVYKTFAESFLKDLGAAMVALPCAGPEMAAAQKKQVGDMGNISDGNQGYPAYMQPALYYAVQYGVTGAPEALAKFESRTVKPDYREGAQFAMASTGDVNSYVPPHEDMPVWQQIATEGQSVSVPDNTEVRFGAGTQWIAKVCSGMATASNDFFGADPAPNVAKVLQQLIPSTEGNPMTHKLSITSIAFANQDLAFGTEAATSLLVELLGPDGAVLGKTTTVPGDITGIVFTDLTAKHTIRASGINSAGVMGAPALQDFVPQDYLPVVVPPADPVPTTASFSLPSAVTFTLAAE